jgi:hypothetical protein
MYIASRIYATSRIGGLGAIRVQFHVEAAAMDTGPEDSPLRCIRTVSGTQVVFDRNANTERAWA